ncbi:MAG: ArnT family glycosyltransferase [bacterium]
MNLDRRTLIVLLIIIAAGLGLRTWGIRFGHPDVGYVDAGATVRPPQRIAYNILNKKFDLDPQYYLYPTFFTNLLAAEYVIYGLFYALSHDSPAGFTEKIDALFKDEKNFHKFELIARINSAITGTLTIFFVFLLGMVASNNDKRIGLIAALFLAFMYLHVKDSHYPMTDATMALFSTIALIYIVKVFLEGTLKNFLYAGLFTGIATGVKYLPITLGLPFACALFFRWNNERKMTHLSTTFYTQIGAAFLLFCLGFLITTPMFIPKFNSFTERMLRTYRGKAITAEEKQAGVKGKLGQTQQNYFDYLFSTTPNWNEPLCINSLMGAMDLPLLILTLMALIYGIWHGITHGVMKGSDEGIINIIFAIYCIVYYLILAKPKGGRAVRYFYLFLPLYCVIASDFLTKAVDLCVHSKKYKNTVLFILALIFVAPTGIRSFRYSRLMSHVDTRILAREWIEKNIPKKSRILMSGLYSPNLSSSMYDLMTYSKPMIRKRILTYDLIVNNKIHYVLLSSYLYDRYFHRETLEEYPEVAATFKKLYDTLEGKATLLHVIENNVKNRPGPTIRIYKINYFP